MVSPSMYMLCTLALELPALLLVSLMSGAVGNYGIIGYHGPSFGIVIGIGAFLTGFAFLTMTPIISLLVWSFLPV